MSKQLYHDKTSILNSFDEDAKETQKRLNNPVKSQENGLSEQIAQQERNGSLKNRHVVDKQNHADEYEEDLRIDDQNMGEQSYDE